MKTALVTGGTGQDGTFLTKLLLEKGYKVISLVRRISTEPPRRVRGKFDFTDAIDNQRLVLEEGDLLSPSALNRIVGAWQPDEVYNLAAQSHVGLSFTQPEFTIDTILDGTINLITALESCHNGKWKMYQASTSEMFGNRSSGAVFHEKTKLRPNSPYAIAKAAAHQYCGMKRGQGQFISCGILFNHESEIRGGDFVTQKIAQGAARWLKTGKPVELGNLNASRDWGYAADYVRAMWLMLQQDEPDDFIVSTGRTHTIREFAELAFGLNGYPLHWEGQGEKELGLTAQGAIAVVVNPQYYRPNDVGYLVGDWEKAAAVLGWKPEHTFQDLVKIMVEAAI